MVFPGAWWLIVLAALGVAAAALDYIQKWRRRRGFRHLAERLGLAYTQRDDLTAERLEFLTFLRRGTIARNVVAGMHHGWVVRVFDAETGSRPFVLSRPVPNAFTCLVVEHEGDFPTLLISPRGPGLHIELALTGDDVELDSAEFAKLFRVRSKDRKLAYDVCHTRMMRYLLVHQDLVVEIARNCLVVRVAPRVAGCEAGLLPVRDIAARLRQLVEIRTLLPRYLFTGTQEKPQCKA